LAANSTGWSAQRARHLPDQELNSMAMRKITIRMLIALAACFVYFENFFFIAKSGQTSSSNQNNLPRFVDSSGFIENINYNTSMSIEP
jgi:hypothetical protein